MTGLTEDLRFRGLVYQVTDEAIFERLDRGGVTVYVGFDPTARSLHLGNLLQLMTLRRMQLAGNRPICVAGGGTGLIGDPSGKDDERRLLGEAELAGNIAALREQLGRYLDFSDGAGESRAILVDNASWLTSLSLFEFLRDVGKHFTINQMIAKDSVRSRLERPDVGISFTELSYMLLQGYDFYRLHLDYGCALQQGGSDQWGNITIGVELVRKLTGDQVFGLTTPLLTKADGSKLGKSTLTDEWVWLDRAMTSPFQLYQYFVNLEDEVVPMMLRALTFLSHQEIVELEAQTTTAPEARAGQRRLARELVAFIHSEADALAAIAASEALFTESVASLDRVTLEAVTADAPSSTVAREALATGIPLVDLLVSTKLCSSLSDARRAIEQGGISVNNVRATSIDAVVTVTELLHDRYVLLRRGKRTLHLVVAV
jgi:tyrosyl-tRNA synthetase